MTDKQLEEIQQQLFFELGQKIDLYHFEKIREIVAVRHEGLITNKEDVLKVFKY
jgi:hypothetical protein